MGKNYNPATIKRRIKRKANTAKIVSKIVHNAEKGKRQARQRMKSKQVKDVVNSLQPEKLKFGAINVDGLDLQTDAALRDLLASRDFDVRSLILFTKFEYKTYLKIIGV